MNATVGAGAPAALGAISAPAAVATPLAAERALHIVVRVGGERFAFPVSHVEEALDAPQIEWVPVAPSGMLGQLAHRGRMIAAWDAGWAFRLMAAARAGAALVLRDGPRRVALVVDDVLEMARIEPADVHDAPAGSDLDGVLTGVCFSAQENHPLVNIVRVDALAALVSARGPILDGGLAAS
jgi:chemotaxis signal transduction protein